MKSNDVTQSNDDDLLTIGIICRNGERHIEMSINSADRVVTNRQSGKTNIVLVDSGSTDSTAGIMQQFATSRPYVTVLSVVGEQNAAVARNAILSQVSAGHIYMVDGDIDLDPDFIELVVEEFRSGRCDAAYGQLPEIWYEADGGQSELKADRYKTSAHAYPGWFKGVVMLSDNVRNSGLRYDERFERLEDIEFSLRVSDQFRIAAIPEKMGIHHTSGYHTAGRLGDFIRNNYQLPAGHLIKRYWRSPAKLWRVRRSFIGYAFGLTIMFGLVVGIVFGATWLIAMCLTIAIVDLIRFTVGRRLVSFVPLRIIGPLQILHGLLSRLPKPPNYTITRYNTAASR